MPKDGRARKAGPGTPLSANMLYIVKSGISQRALDTLKRLAAFKNPEFYRAQAMRMSTYGKPRIISCSEETSEYLCLPRGCEGDLATLLREAGVKVKWSDKTHPGRHLEAAFTGVLREDQELAAEAMLKYDCGVLSAATAFGKTVIAAKLIAERRTNTLILTTGNNCCRSGWRSHPGKGWPDMPQ